jgi:hypothetical protein
LDHASLPRRFSADGCFANSYFESGCWLQSVYGGGIIDIIYKIYKIPVQEAGLSNQSGTIMSGPLQGRAFFHPGSSHKEDAMELEKKYKVIGGAAGLVLAVCLFLVPAALANGGFDDVPPEHMFYDQIMWLVDNGITSGCSVTPPLYCPDAAVSRGQMAVFMKRGYDLAEANDDDTILDAGFGLDRFSGHYEIDIYETQTRVDHVCPSGTAMRIIASDGSALCEPVGSGDIEGVTAGTGLTGGGETGTVELNADSTYLQRRVSSSCAAGSSIRTINQDGTVLCEPDNDTVFSPSLTSEYTVQTTELPHDVQMIHDWEGFCFLTFVGFKELDSSDELSTCEVYVSSGFWHLQAWASHSGDNSAICKARCITW